MNPSLLPSLRCPSCGEGFEATHAEREGDELRYGLLRCRCNTYPIVAGIPVLAEDQARKARDLITAGRRQEALLALLYPPVAALAHRWIRTLPDLPGLREIRRAAHDREWKRLAGAVTSRPDRLTAVDLLDLPLRPAPPTRRSFFRNPSGEIRRRTDPGPWLRLRPDHLQPDAARARPAGHRYRYVFLRPLSCEALDRARR
jgi:uncharacterized protein YbaR (Trm112 family)